ncbi:hypothetical protein TNCV_1038651 [Trichonephila clavipes]|uniref:Uncharacterized protein n=1 Tax=Trichonephila clavipes TaxID=2585209 RepID=A0A8X7B8R4_TRICX|nr:hypothetical protein TNCV_1038651 [Trichonephila clavipes]
MRDYRTRKNSRIQSTSVSHSVVHHQEDEMLLADDSLNSSHELVGLPCKISTRQAEKQYLSVCESTDVVEEMSLSPN